jgi:23S rRNA pseudouridine955/2504/2580 synthase
VTITEEEAGQRIDNFLLRVCKGVPKATSTASCARAKCASTKAVSTSCTVCRRRRGAHSARARGRKGRHGRAGRRIQDHLRRRALLVIDKPAGVAVHGGSGVSFGVIEQLRASRPDAKFLELVHRLDRETSGLLLLAKKRSALTNLHEQMRDGVTDKRYLTLVAGDWKNARQHIKLPLHKYTRPKASAAWPCRPMASLAHGVSLLQKFRLRLAGSGTEDRPHAPDPRAPVIVGFPIAGDDKYGDLPSTRRCRRRTARAAPSSACSCMRTRSRSRIRKRARR